MSKQKSTIRLSIQPNGTFNITIQLSDDQKVDLAIRDLDKASDVILFLAEKIGLNDDCEFRLFESDE